MSLVAPVLVTDPISDMYLQNGSAPGVVRAFRGLPNFSPTQMFHWLLAGCVEGGRNSSPELGGSGTD